MPQSRELEARWLASAPEAPVQQRSAWPALTKGERWHLLTARDSSGRDVASVGVRDYPSRALPGFRILAVHKFGLGVSPEALPLLLVALRDYARSLPTVLRVQVEAFMLDEAELDRLSASATHLGFEKLPVPREYERTLVVDLTGSEEEFTGRFHRMVMKNVRKTEREGHCVLPVTDPRYARRMQQLADETMGRTGAQADDISWTSIVEAARENPDVFRVSGLFLGGDRSPEALVAFRWCGRAGAGADDLMAASTRRQGPTGGVPMMPAVLLETFRWARSHGARWFDFGGVVTEDDPRYAQLGSIAEFKGLFSRDMRRVGADFRFVPHPLLSRVAAGLSGVAQRFGLR